MLRQLLLHRGNARTMSSLAAGSATLPASSTSVVDLLRAEMSRAGLSGYICPSEDAHQSEYVRDVDKRRHFLSGFDGSAGTAVITMEEACMWTDGRYYLQAERQMPSQWSLMKTGEKTTPSVSAWLGKTVPGMKVGFDPRMSSIMTVEGWKRDLDRFDVKLVEDKDNKNLVDSVWGEHKPAPPCEPVKPLDLRFSGEESASKLAQLRSEMKNKGVQIAVVSALDEVAWLLNLRGSDIDYNPVFMSFLLVGSGGEATLCAEPSQLSSRDTKECLELAGVNVKPYGSVSEALQQILKNYEISAHDSGIPASRAVPKSENDNAPGKKVRVWLDPSTCNWDIFRKVQHLGMLPVRDSPLSVQLSKSLKNKTELDGMRNCHIRDGAALCSHFAWLENQLSSGKEVCDSLDEVTVSDHLEARRKREEHFVGLSFETISSSGPNGAIIHYAPRRGACRAVTADELYLCDSGAQYLDGTTDVTRTMHFGTPTAHQRRCYTRVLQGHIALASARFPAGTMGHKLDILARMPLFSDGLDYGHGTGHGVGAYGCVHEGPQGIGMRPRCYDKGLQEGMTMTIEPGYYEDGNFGIRIENVHIVVKKETLHQHGGHAFLGFENITWVPIQTKLVDTELLSPDELQWLNMYNLRCREILVPQLQSEPETVAWVMRETEPLPDRS